MRKHDENKCLRIVGTRCKVSLYDKSIEASKSTIIGNKMWGRIDFLVNHCGYRFYWTAGPVSINKVNNSSDYKDTKRALKKAAKEQTLTDKTKRKKK